MHEAAVALLVFVACASVGLVPAVRRLALLGSVEFGAAVEKRSVLRRRSRGGSGVHRLVHRDHASCERGEVAWRRVLDELAGGVEACVAVDAPIQVGGLVWLAESIGSSGDDAAVLARVELLSTLRVELAAQLCAQCIDVLEIHLDVVALLVDAVRAALLEHLEGCHALLEQGNLLRCITAVARLERGADGELARGLVGGPDRLRHVLGDLLDDDGQHVVRKVDDRSIKILLRAFLTECPIRGDTGASLGGDALDVGAQQRDHALQRLCLGASRW